MATIIQLTDSCGGHNKLYLNADNIRYFDMLENGATKITKIYLIDQDYAIDVTESAEEVMRLINN